METGGNFIQAGADTEKWREVDVQSGLKVLCGTHYLFGQLNTLKNLALTPPLENQ